MKILVTGGTGVVGAGIIPELLARGHEVRVLSRNADEDARRWQNVEPVAGDVSDAMSLRSGVATCDAIVHIAGIVTEQPPDVTFDKVNVQGTRNVVDEAVRSGITRFIFMSSLGADRGSTDYHRSKREAEEIVRAANLQWTILRPGNVYGPGDEVISTILKMIRALPAIPVLASDEHRFQPIWFSDLGKATAAVIERNDLAGQTLELAGPEVTSVNHILASLGEITGRTPVKVPVPMPIASFAAKVAGYAADIPFDETKLTMLRENNVLPEGSDTVLDRLGVVGTSLDEGLRKLADLLPENLAEDGVGAMHHKRFWADIAGSPHSPAALMTIFKQRVTDLMPIEFASEPGAATTIERGVTMTGALPLRGHFQVRVEVSEPTRVVFATLEGHPLAGIVEFTTSSTQTGIRFAIDTWTRASNIVDYLAMKTVGEPSQSANWRAVVENVVEASGGTSDGVETQSQKLDEEEAELAADRIRSMIQSRQRSESTSDERAAQR
ncbi:MAG TPA: NAD(P)H-binding protein [Thermoanaerobaculia bacterium]|nr:NAD(P)H-binding protein [Thermoanaerobaculia bacterium]